MATCMHELPLSNWPAKLIPSKHTPAVRVCTVNLATCKNTTNTNFVDACEAKVEVQEDKTTTYNNCTCTGWPGWWVAAAAAAAVAGSRMCTRLHAALQPDVWQLQPSSDAWQPHTSAHLTASPLILLPARSYVYQTGLNVTYMSCANPDGDPLGSWCAIDPTKCDRFAGQLNVPGGVVSGETRVWAGVGAGRGRRARGIQAGRSHGGKRGAQLQCGHAVIRLLMGSQSPPLHGTPPAACQVVNYDYCNSAPLSARRDPSVCTDRVSEYEQCGGKSHCTAYGCADEVWPGVCCPSGLTCHRQNAYYYQCLTDEDAAAARAAAAAAAAAAGGSASPAGPLPGQASPSPQVVTPVASPDPASPPAVRVKVPGFEVKNTLRLNYDFNKLLVPGGFRGEAGQQSTWGAGCCVAPAGTVARAAQGVLHPLGSCLTPAAHAITPRRRDDGVQG